MHHLQLDSLSNWWQSRKQVKVYMYRSVYVYLVNEKRKCIQKQNLANRKESTLESLCSNKQSMIYSFHCIRNMQLDASCRYVIQHYYRAWVGQVWTFCVYTCYFFFWQSNFGCRKLEVLYKLVRHNHYL